MYIGNRTLKKIKVEYFNSIMKQDQKWFDQTDVYQFTTKVHTQCTVIEHGVHYFKIDRREYWEFYSSCFAICYMFYYRI